MSQRQLSKCLGLEATAVYRTEKGTRLLDVIEFYEIARSLGRDPVELFAAFIDRVDKSALDRKSKRTD